MPDKVLDLVADPRDGASVAAARSHILVTPAPRFLLLHYHIFKNAGTTIEFILSREFGDAFTRLHGSHPGSTLAPAEAADFVARHPNLRALSSHHLTYPLPKIPGTVIFDVCFLRDPLQRIWSFYKHLKRMPPEEELGDLAQNAGLPAFLSVLIRDHPHLANNLQVNRLANGGAYTRAPDESDLARAAAIARQASVLGVVDLFDQSCVAAEYALRPAFPNFRMHYARQNASPALPDDGGSFRQAAGKQAYRQLLELNQLDVQLVRTARKEVLRRYTLAPESEQRLQEFRDRCAAQQLPA